MFEFRTAINKEIECRINYMINYEEYICKIRCIRMLIPYLKNYTQ